MKTGFAKITVQQSFCSCCSRKIKKELLKINDISNVRMYPIECLVIFNFIKADEVAAVLNVLTALGYPPKGEVNKYMPKRIVCTC